MNENFPDEPIGDARIPATPDDALVARVRAADPAATIEPDAVVLRAAVETRRAADGGQVTTGVDELAAARARRWTAWPARLAGVAAAALVIGGGGGYAIGAAGDDQAPLATGAGREITLDAGSGPVAPNTLGTGPVPEAAMDQSVRGGTDMYWPGYSGRTIFTASGLSEAGGSAQAWAFDPAQVFTEQSIATAAAALGVAGTPTLQDGYWSVGPMDGTGPNVTLYPDGSASLSYYDPGKDPWSCTVTLEDTATGSGAAEGGAAGSDGEASDGAGTDDSATTLEQSTEPSAGMVAPDDPCVQRDLGPAPDGDTAAAALRDVMTALGIDVAGYELVAENWGDASWQYVTAYQVIDGQRTGASWSGSFTGAGLQSLYGSLAPVVSLGEYQVISPAAAVARFADPRFGSGWGGPIAYLDGAEPFSEDPSVTSEMAVEPTLPATVAPGSAISWPVDEVTIVEARLGVAMHWQADGATMLLPTYELISADGGIWSMLAVADAHLDFSSGR